MRRTLPRWVALTATALTLTLTLGAVAAFPTAAHADTPDVTGAGGDINVLPSAVTGGLGPNAPAAEKADFLYGASKSKSYWSAVKDWAVRTGATASTSVTGAQRSTMGVTLEKAATRIPAGRALAFLGPAGEVITAYQVGTSITNNGAKLFGFDPAGYVCENTGSDFGGTLVRIADGASCGANKPVPAYVPNTDAKGVSTAAKICDDTGRCYTYTGNATARMGGDTPSVWLCGYMSGTLTPGTPWATIVLKIDGKIKQTAVYGSDVSYYNICGAAGQHGDGPVLYGQNDLGTHTDAEAALALKLQCMYTGNTRYSTDPCSEGPVTTPPPATSSNPTRTLTCVVTGTDGQKYQGSGAHYTETDATIPTPQCPALPDGVTAKNVQVQRTTDGQSGTQVLGNYDTDPAVSDWQQKYPGCTTNSLCALTLYKGDAQCQDTNDGCDGWYDDPAKSSTYSCKYGVPGSQTFVDLSECDVYKSRFTAEAENSGDKLTDPDSGKTLTNPTPGNDPGSEAAIEAGPHDDKLGPYKCFPSGWGALNPVSWIIQPMKCLAIPRPGAVDLDLADFSHVADDTLPAKLAKTVSSYDFKTPGNGCSGVPIHLGGVIPDFSILAACPGDVLAPMAAFGRTFLDLSMTVLGVLAIVKFIAAPFGFSPLGRRDDDE